jgi:hypothetical protein
MELSFCCPTHTCRSQLVGIGPVGWIGDLRQPRAGGSRKGPHRVSGTRLRQARGFRSDPRKKDRLAPTARRSWGDHGRAETDPGALWPGLNGESQINNLSCQYRLIDDFSRRTSTLGRIFLTKSNTWDLKATAKRRVLMYQIALGALGRRFSQRLLTPRRPFADIRIGILRWLTRRILCIISIRLKQVAQLLREGGGHGRRRPA